MPFATVTASLVNAEVGRMLRLAFSKTMPSVSVANIPHTLWKATGLPTAGADPTTGAANGRTLDKTSIGALDLQDAVTSSSEQTFLFAGGATSITANATGSLIVCDRMADVNLGCSDASGAITGVSATARMASTTAPGDGGQLWTEVTTAFSAASNTVSYSATDALGNATTVGGSAMTASAVAGRSINSNLWQPLAAGSWGIRDLTALTLSVNNAATGNYNACIVRPLGYIPMVASQQYVERDFIVELPNLARVYENACLFFIYVPGAAVTATIFGELRTNAG